ncbi:uncharacterized protein LOC123526457 [Mercenaria mercenaria]|uniref:uncharacterized protein LOC123526457 n=1 Tax=Mercenaria mercenaria TaxID=6596 RepID=UPI00234F9D70|nr:uncharacterized protein LOC123526457 [Mercenaria mercenaria]XP_045161549.2 uncharacterized protein LOC123526457 [Mercenaria mercenaria]
MVDIRMPSEENHIFEENTCPGSVNAADDDVCLLGSSVHMPKPDVEKKETRVEMSLIEAARLITYLNDASDLLSRHVDELQYIEMQKETPMFQRCHCTNMKTAMSKMISKFTGAKGISATVILQLVCIIMLALVDCLPKNDDDKQLALKYGSIAMLFLQTLNLIVVILISVQLLSQIQKREVTRILLAQSYIATVLLFSGIYTASYRMDPRSWKFVSDAEENLSPVMIVTLYTRFLFFSVSTATLCGAADALPKEWYTSLFVSAQMLLSFMYFTSVLGTTLSKRRRPAPKAKILSKELVRFQENQGRKVSKTFTEIS